MIKLINIKISANETYWINSEKISVEPDEQYKISSKIVGKKGIFRSCYFTVFLLDKEEKEIIRKWRWITDFSENEINYDIIFTTVPKTKYLISGYRVNLETDRKADVELEVQELTKLKFEKIANRVNDLYDNRLDYRYPLPGDYDIKDDLEDIIKPKTKYDLINWFAKEYNFSSYLEISTLTTGHYFDKIDSNFFKIKDCINYYVEEHDPLYSKFGNTVLKDHDFKILPFDDYLNKIIDKKQKYDVIFVDPFHTVEHTIRDLEAALSLLSSTGIIIVHDCFPDSEALIGPWKEGDWCGQTYEGYIRFLLKNSHFENFVINIDCGCGIIRPHYKSTIKRDFAVDAGKLSSWEYYWDHHNQLLNLKSIDKFNDLYAPKENL